MEYMTFADSINPPAVDPTIPVGVARVPAPVTQAEVTINSLTNDPATVAVIETATQKISPKGRRVIYIIGIALGVVVTIGGAVAGTLTGNAATIEASASGLALSLTNLLAVLHLNVPVKTPTS